MAVEVSPEKPYSESCERNKYPILNILRLVFAKPGTVLEIGSGTGQHALHMAIHLPQINWQSSDRAEYLPGIRSWLSTSESERLLPPLELDVLKGAWPSGPYEYVFSANTTHIMNWPAVQAMFSGIGKLLVAGGSFCLYGPFNVGGAYTSESNAAFDRMLRARDPDSGLRDREGLEKLAADAGLVLEAEHEMPANNRMLVWRKR